MVTGQTVTDQGGTQYSMPAGVFRFPLVAPGNYRLEVRAAGQLRLPLAAHDRRSADAAERAVPPAARFLRSELRDHRGAGRGGRYAARSERQHAAAAQDRRSADRDHRRLRAVHADAAEHQRARARSPPCRWSTICRPARATAPVRCASMACKVADPTVAADGSSFTYLQPRLEAGPDHHAALRARIHRRDARHEGRRSTPRRPSRPATCARTRRARWCA